MRGRGDPRLSAEVDLLEYLYAEDQPLSEARLPFPTLDHARRVVKILVKSGAVELFRCDDPAETAVPDWQIKGILDDDSNWQPHDNSEYLLRLTPSGLDQFTHDSQRLFDDLFGQ